ncbi:MAG: hypothetical protein SFV15_05945 [Polyangiaceae bacterium]|nr:hypothetical protein [Polyangiaceae bacterium]
MKQLFSPFIFTACLLASSVRADEPRALLLVAGESLTRNTVQSRLNAAASWQLEPFGPTKEQRAEGFVRGVLGLELMEAAEAKARHLDATPAGRDARKVILARALEASLLQEIIAQDRVKQADIERYFADHRSEFIRPPSVAVWRIVVTSEARALAIIQECQGTGGLAKWRQIARAESVDHATHMRAGDLGFVRADGSTTFPQLRVSPQIYAALANVEDGAIAPKPLKLDENYAVLWRRGSLGEERADLRSESPKIADLLRRKALSEDRGALLDRLRKQHLKDHNPLLLEVLDGKAF